MRHFAVTNVITDPSKHHQRMVGPMEESCLGRGGYMVSNSIYKLLITEKKSYQYLHNGEIYWIKNPT